jgi:hypothetical protein
MKPFLESFEDILYGLKDFPVKDLTKKFEDKSVIRITITKEQLAGLLAGSLENLVFKTKENLIQIKLGF